MNPEFAKIKTENLFEWIQLILVSPVIQNCKIKIFIFAVQFKSLLPKDEAFEFIKKDGETGLNEVLATCRQERCQYPVPVNIPDDDKFECW